MVDGPAREPAETTPASARTSANTPVPNATLPAPVLAILALSAALAVLLFGLKVRSERGPDRTPLSARPSPIEAWPLFLEPMPHGVRLELDGPRAADVTATLLRLPKKGRPVPVSARTIARSQDGPVDWADLVPETDYQLRFTAPGSKVVPSHVPFSTRPPRTFAPATTPDLPTLFAISEDLDPAETDRVAALWRATAPLPALTYPPALRLARRMRSRPLLAALIDKAPPDLPPAVWLDLTNLALDLGDRDRSRAAFRHCEPAAPSLASGAYARAALELEGAPAFARVLALLSKAPPLDTDRAATALLKADRQATRAAAERWLWLEANAPQSAPSTPGATAEAPASASRPSSPATGAELTPRLERLAVGCLVTTALADDPKAHEPVLMRIARSAGAARQMHHLARLLIDTGRPEARLTLYALLDREPRALNEPGVIWELARAAAAETASDRTRAALDAAGAVLVGLVRGSGPLETREAAAAALGIVPAREAIAVLGVAVRAGPPRVAAAAAWALVTRRDRSHVSSLLEFAESARDETGVGAWACGMLGTRDAVERLALVLARLPRDRSQLPRRLLVGFAMARLGNDGRGWQALDDARTDLPFGHFLALQAHADRDTIWLFPFVGLAPLTPRLMPGQSVQVQASGFWCARVEGQWITAPATRPLGDDPGAARAALTLELGARRHELGLTPLTAVTRQSAPALIRQAEPRVTDPLPIVDPGAVAGCAVVRVRVADL